MSCVYYKYKYINIHIGIQVPLISIETGIVQKMKK